MCREGDEIHLVHVVPKLQMGICYGAPPVDFLPQQDPIAYDQLVTQAESFIQMRFLPSLHNLRVHPIVHIVKVRLKIMFLSIPCTITLTQESALGLPSGHITPAGPNSI